MFHRLFPGRTVTRHRREAESRRRLMVAVDPATWPSRQLELAERMWSDAIADIPYYASLVSSGLAPDRITSWPDLAAIPVLTRQLLQERPSDFVRRSGPPDSFITTAGSTGTPLRMGLSQDERDLMRIVKLAEWQALGYVPGSRLFLIWGHAHLLGTGWKGQVKHLQRRTADAFLGYRRVDAYRLNRKSCAGYADALLRFRPTGLIGYASALDLFARYTSEYRERFRALGLRFVLATAEAPPRPDTTALLSDLFDCPVVQEYGGAEFGQVAFKAGQADFEVYPDLNYVEAEPASAIGVQEHGALVTALYRRYVPLFRYRVGDTLIDPHVLSNGHVSRFGAVGGRINDVIHFSSSDAIHSVAVFHCIHQEPAVYNIQMVLRDSGIEIWLVTLPTDRPAMEARITSRLVQVHPAFAAVRFVYVEDLPASRAGKRRWYVDHRTSNLCAASPAS